ncbi:MAG: hypothetical protein S4CHLAM123_07170 [Chlamydiales bacterium]|nr:hypothetical protein [Chlamydiales bacterium]
MISILNNFFSICNSWRESKYKIQEQENQVIEISKNSLLASQPSKKRKIEKVVDLTTLPSKKRKLNAYDKTRFLQTSEIQDYFIYLSTLHPILVADAPRRADLNYVEEQLNNSDLTLNQPFFLNISDIHWTFLYIDHLRGNLEYYDSLKDFGEHSKIMERLKEIAEQLTSRTGKEYQVLNKITEKIQTDGYQCGVWVTYFLEKRLEDPNFDFNTLSEQPPALIKDQRKKVFDQLQIIEDKLTEVNKKELKRFVKFYGDQPSAKNAKRLLLTKISRVERISDILRGRSIVPN